MGDIVALLPIIATSVPLNFVSLSVISIIDVPSLSSISIDVPCNSNALVVEPTIILLLDDVPKLDAVVVSGIVGVPVN